MNVYAHAIRIEHTLVCTQTVFSYYYYYYFYHDSFLFTLYLI
jgi:hypothetical protein